MRKEVNRKINLKTKIASKNNKEIGKTFQAMSIPRIQDVPFINLNHEEFFIVRNSFYYASSYITCFFFSRSYSLPCKFNIEVKS